MENQCVTSVFPTAKTANPPDPEKQNPAQVGAWNGANVDQAERRDQGENNKLDSHRATDFFKRRIVITKLGCWEWQGYRDRDGYGRVSIAGKQQQAHRASYALSIGPIPQGLFLHHLCLNKSCCNPLHLEAVTPQENTRRNLSPPSCNARKTRCDHGHAFDDANTYRHANRRHCRECNREAVRRYAARKSGGAQ